MMMEMMMRAVTMRTIDLYIKNWEVRNWEPAAEKKESRADPGCTIIMTDLTFIPAASEIQKMTSKIPILQRSLSNRTHGEAMRK